jgi:hypothetical protein
VGLAAQIGFELLSYDQRQSAAIPPQARAQASRARQSPSNCAYQPPLRQSILVDQLIQFPFTRTQQPVGYD